MLQTLQIEDFRGQTTEYSFGQLTGIYGANGQGKTTIREAIAFLLTGTDSAGNKAPVHLISREEDKCKVSGVTSKGATISRTLTAKKSSTLKLERQGVVSNLSQSELEGLVGSQDLVLSILVPGFFFHALPNQRRHKVLSEVLPSVNNQEVLEELAGFQLTDHEVSRYSTAKRADLAAQTVAQDRRETQKLFDENRGKLSQIDSMPAPGEEPLQPPAVAKKKYLEKLKKEWEDYNTALHNYERAEADLEAVRRENERKEQERQKLRKDLEEIKICELPAVPYVEDRIQDLRSQKKDPPAAPPHQNLPESDHCPTCGQVVGSKHRDQVKRENEKRRKEYEEVCEEVKLHNQKIEDQIGALEGERDIALQRKAEVEELNRKAEVQKSRISAKLEALTNAPEPQAIPEKPEPPTESYDEEEYKSACDETAAFEKAHAQWEWRVQCAHEDQHQKAEIEKENARYAETIERLKILEGAFKDLPQKILEKQKEALAMENYEVDIEGEVSLRHKDGRPESILSTGEAMRGHIEFCKKLNQLAKRPVGMIFVDNADLVDDLARVVEEDPIQFFMAHVTRTQKVSLFYGSEAFSRQA